MNLVEDSVLINIAHRQALQNKLNRLTPWQKLITCAWLLGWSQKELADMAQVKEQNISEAFVRAKKKMGVYWQTL